MTFRLPGTTSLRHFLSGPTGITTCWWPWAILVIVINLRLQNSRIGRPGRPFAGRMIAAGRLGINTRNIAAGFQLKPASEALLGSLPWNSFRRRASRWIDRRSWPWSLLGGMGHIPGVILGAVCSSCRKRWRYGVRLAQMALFGGNWSTGKPTHADLRFGAGPRRASSRLICGVAGPQARVGRNGRGRLMAEFAQCSPRPAVAKHFGGVKALRDE